MLHLTLLFNVSSVNCIMLCSHNTDSWPGLWRLQGPRHVGLTRFQPGPLSLMQRTEAASVVSSQHVHLPTKITLNTIFYNKFIFVSQYNYQGYFLNKITTGIGIIQVIYLSKNLFQRCFKLLHKHILLHNWLFAKFSFRCNYPLHWFTATNLILI